MSNKKMDEALRTFLFEHDALKAQNEWLVGEIQKQATKVAVLRKADEENRQLKQAIERLERYQGESTDIINAQRKKRSELEEKIKGLKAKVDELKDLNRHCLGSYYIDARQAETFIVLNGRVCRGGSMSFIEFKDVTINLDRVLFFRRDKSRIYATFQGKEESPIIIYVGEHVVDAHNLLMYLINRSKG